MKLFLQWCRLHPWKFTLLVLYCFACGATMRVDFVWGLVVLVIGYGGWAIIYMLDTNKLLGLLVAASLMCAPSSRAQEFEPAAPFVIGGVVVIVAAGLGFIGCKAVKACKNISRGRTNAAPEELQFQVAGGGEYGALFSWSEPGYCLAERRVPVIPTVFALNIAVESASNATVTCTASSGHDLVQRWEEFKENMASHGLAVTAGPDLASYERNRHPAQAEQVPIAFNFSTRTATLGRGGILVTVERSHDLRTWEPLLSLNVEAGGLPLRIEDASATQQFFRVKLSRP